MTRISQAFAVGLCAFGLACGAPSQGRFPMTEVVWTDPDTRLFSEAPEGFYSSPSWDGADNSVFRPLAELWLFRTDREALNVNALDEVPDSSWYVNRFSRRLLSAEEVARGACASGDSEIPRPWTIVGGKPDGANPGFQIRDANGVRYLMKTDGDLQHERPGAADVVGALIWHSAGFNVPCNSIVTFERSDLVSDPEATIRRTRGTEEPLTEAHIEEVLSKATRLPDGRYRASVSRFVDGRPISPWRYHGRRHDDPNDAIPHEDRRDLRGQFVLSAWTDHIDARHENTMAAWAQPGEGEAGFVRHYMIDFGDCFGVLHPWDDLVRRFGHSGYLDVQHMVEDFLTFGFINRPWNDAAYGAAGVTLGYYDVRRFVPDQWRIGYPNHAYDRLTETDAAWMTRIVSRFRDEHIEAMVERARFSDPLVASELTRILIGRRDRILERWLTRLSPLAWPDVRAGADGPRVCMQDLATWSEIRDARFRRYRARAWTDEPITEVELPSAPTHEDDAYVCQALPRLEGATADRPRYLIVDLVASTPEAETTSPARLHFYAFGETDFRLVGLERPSRTDPPR